MAYTRAEGLRPFGNTIQGANWLLIDGWTFDGSGAPDSCHLLSLSGCDHVVIQNCTFTSTGWHSIYFGSGVRRVVISGCVFDGGVRWPTGAYIYSSYDGIIGTIAGCRFTNVGSQIEANQALYLHEGSWRIYHCQFDNCAKGIDVRAGATAHVYHSTWYPGVNGSGAAIAYAIFDRGQGSVFANNTITASPFHTIVRLSGHLFRLIGNRIIGADDGVIQTLIELEGTGEVINNAMTGTQFGNSCGYNLGGTIRNPARVLVRGNTVRNVRYLYRVVDPDGTPPYVCEGQNETDALARCVDAQYRIIDPGALIEGQA